ncbi:TIM23 complex component [Dimargaris cristalligena]|uniref:Presequence translocated-associated motor subunit PAM17 n=1 Tax=Dimargaris cristalligena TaxID=215637 RepID=A0A4Q0A0Z6_9FUNG|nr:TIM23 complex component [Dimargaris cristalligena]RKP39408.1 mitochondrial import protein Pam17-domain-containing protein [Dimargaris cristalligena]|eukprot:RKP39408.1 mitochondrial import protein Pam17-domain-containing protein [Dimargaris cristalligena]
MSSVLFAKQAASLAVGRQLLPRLIATGPTLHSAASTTPPSPQTQTQTQTDPATDLTWDQFFKMRRNRRLVERMAIVPSTLSTLSIGGLYFLDQEIDPTAMIFGFDPILVYGIGMVGCGLAGFLLGPVFGGGLWKLSHRQWSKRMESKDVEFYKHIVQNRADPSQHSFRNPIPDFYGEKINSLADYRKWLRKQRAHQQKAQFHLGSES